MSEHIRRTIEDFTTELAAAEATVAELKQLLNGLHRKLGEPEPYEIGGTSTRAGYRPRLDEFANETAPSPAIRRLLETRGREGGPMMISEVLQVLRQGAYPFGSRRDDAILPGLRIAISKDDKLLRLGDDAVGLAEWYPKRRRLKDKKKDGDADDTEADSVDEQEDGESAVTTESEN